MTKTLRTLIIGLIVAGVLIACSAPSIKPGGEGQNAATKEAGQIATKAATSAATSAATMAVGGASAVTPPVVGAGAATKPATQPAATTELTVTGSATYRERIVLPANTVMTVQVQDVTGGDNTAVVIGEYKGEIGTKTPPYPFSIRLDAAKIVLTRTYVVSVKLEVDGKLRFINTSRPKVLTGTGSADAGEIVLSAVN